MYESKTRGAGGGHWSGGALPLTCVVTDVVIRTTVTMHKIHDGIDFSSHAGDVQGCVAVVVKLQVVGPSGYEALNDRHMTFVWQ